MDFIYIICYSTTVSVHGKENIEWILVLTFLCMVFIFLFWMAWIEQNRKDRYIALQRELMQKRSDTLDMDKDGIPNEQNLKQLREEKLLLCTQLFQTTDVCKRLRLTDCTEYKGTDRMTALERATICKAVNATFVDVMIDLKNACNALNHDDLLFCIFSLLGYSKSTIILCMNIVSDGAFKMRKSRIKDKMEADLFDWIFNKEVRLIP